MDELRLALLDVGELDLLEFLGVGIEGRSGEGGVERRLAGGLVAVADQLRINLRVDRLTAGIDDFVAHVDHVGATMERVGLHQTHATHFIGFKAQHQLFGAVRQRALAAELHGRLVGGEIAANQAGLGLVDPFRAGVEQHKRRIRLLDVAVLQEFAVDDGAALGVERQLEHIGADVDAFAW